MTADSNKKESENNGAIIVETHQWRTKEFVTLNDSIVEEVPVALVYNGISHAVMMATPCYLEDFAIGFSLTEGVINDISQVYDIDINSHPNGYTIDLTINSERMHYLKQKKRSLTGNTGCGICGLTSLDQLQSNGNRLEAYKLPSPTAIQHAVTSLASWQTIQQQTGACHAVVWCNSAGEKVLLREDVGRHNAFDKLIGAMKHHKIDSQNGFILISSRASYEMIHKASILKCANLVAISAPTSMAVEQAKALNINLIGFARDTKYNIYNNTIPINLNDNENIL